MKNEYLKFKHGDLTVEVNWDGSEKPFENVKFTINEKEAIVSVKDLYALMMAVYQDKEDLLILKTRRVKKIRKMVKVKTKKKVEAGGYIVFPLEYYVPEDVYDDIQELEGVPQGLTEEEAKNKLK
jgi:hypothetical protein